MSVLHQFYSRVYAHEEPKGCPEHGPLRLTDRGVWYCDWTRTEMRPARNGYCAFTVRCTYRPGRSHVEVEAEDGPDLSFLLAKSIEEVERGSPR